jgi:hypothetical protein
MRSLLWGGFCRGSILVARAAGLPAVGAYLAFFEPKVTPDFRDALAASRFRVDGPLVTQELALAADAFRGYSAYLAKIAINGIIGPEVSLWRP